MNLVNELFISAVLSVTALVSANLGNWTNMPTVIFSESTKDQSSVPVRGSIGCIEQSTWYYLPKVREKAIKAGREEELSQLVTAFKSENKHRRSERYLLHSKLGKIIEVSYASADQKSAAGQELCRCVATLMKK